MANKAAIIESELGLEQKVIALMACIVQELKSSHERKISSLNVSGLQLKLLEALDGSLGGTLTVGQLKAKMPDDFSNVSRTINKLTKMSLATKKRSAEDQRVVHVTITVFGRQVCRTAQASGENVTISLSDGDLKQLYELLKKI